MVGHFGCQGTPMTPGLLQHVQVFGEAVSFMVTAGKSATRTRHAAFLQVSIMTFFMFGNAGWKGFVAIPTKTYFQTPGITDLSPSHDEVYLRTLFCLWDLALGTVC